MVYIPQGCKNGLYIVCKLLFVTRYETNISFLWSGLTISHKLCNSFSKKWFFH